MLPRLKRRILIPIKLELVFILFSVSESFLSVRIPNDEFPGSLYLLVGKISLQSLVGVVGPDSYGGMAGPVCSGRGAWMSNIRLRQSIHTST